MTRRLVVLALGITLWLASSVALAVSDDLSNIGPMAFLYVSGETRVYALTADGHVVWRGGVTRTWTRVPNPPGVNSFYLASGVAAAEPDPTWEGYDRVFAVSAPAGMNPATLYELSESGVWRALNAPMGASLSDAPSIAAVAGSGVRADDGVRVGVRLSDGHVWTCWIQTSTGPCSWEDESIRGGTHLASPTSPIEIAYNTYTADFDVFSVTSSGVLQRYSWWADSWDPGIPSLPSPYIVDQTDISVAGTWNDYRVLVAAWDQASVGDELFVLRSSNGGSSWVWTQLEAKDGATTPRGGVNYRRFSLHQAFGTFLQSTGFRAFFTSATEDEGWVCSEPNTLSGGTATCSGWNGGLPPDLMASRDYVGPSIIGSYGPVGANGYLVGRMQNISGTGSHMDYLFDLEVRAPLTDFVFRWRNLLTARDVISGVRASVASLRVRPSTATSR